MAARELSVVDEFADALAARRFADAGELFHADGRLRGLVPSALREATGPTDVAQRLELWFGDAEGFEVLETEVAAFADRVKVRYRFACIDPEEGPQIVEQQGFAEVVDGKIATLSLVCSGFRPRS